MLYLKIKGGLSMKREKEKAVYVFMVCVVGAIIICFIPYVFRMILIK